MPPTLRDLMQMEDEEAQPEGEEEEAPPLPPHSPPPATSPSSTNTVLHSSPSPSPEANTPSPEFIEIVEPSRTRKKNSKGRVVEFSNGPNSNSKSEESYKSAETHFSSLYCPVTMRERRTQSSDPAFEKELHRSDAVVFKESDDHHDHDRDRDRDRDDRTDEVVEYKGNISRVASMGVISEKYDLEDLNVARSNSLPENGGDGGGSLMDEAWERLRSSYVFYRGRPVGTLAALDTSTDALNYNQVFVRDFFPTALACLMKKHNPEKGPNQELEMVRNFLVKTLHLQGWEKRVDNFTLAEGVMPASFKVLPVDSERKKETMVADFGGTAIGRVAPVDSGFWWIILLRSYTRCTRDFALRERPEIQRGVRLILNLCLAEGFDTFPTLLCADGCSMIDRRMGIYGYPIEIQALFYFALRSAREILKPDRAGREMIDRIDKRISALRYHIRQYYWLDHTQLNNIYRYRTEEYSHTAVNKFNVIPESIPNWVFDFMPVRGGYLIGNVSPARMDFRWFLIGNCIAILSCLTTSAQAMAIMDLIEKRWDELIGQMPLKIVYPALEGDDWRIVTGYDPKNTRWSYHNGGSWPAASIKTARPQIAKRAIDLAEKRLSKDGWPEYYDGKDGQYIGKQARKYQSWSIAGYLVAKLLVEDPSNLVMISMDEEDKKPKPKHGRSNSN